MKKHLRYGIWAVALATSVTGCDGGSSRATSGGSGGVGGLAMGRGGTAGGTDGLGGAGGGVPLVDWVTDLAVNYAADTHPPDTVDDKVIIDTEDSQAFDPLLQR